MGLHAAQRYRSQLDDLSDLESAEMLSEGLRRGGAVAAQREPKVGRRPGNQDTRGQIITAARQTFAEKGFAGASMRAIAAEAAVDPALIHHYFDSKQQLFLATVALPLELPDIVKKVAAGARDDLGERLVRTVLGETGRHTPQPPDLGWSLPGSQRPNDTPDLGLEL